MLLMRCATIKWTSGVSGKSRRAEDQERTIPDSNHVLRYCRPNYVKMEAIKAGAFELRPGEEFLSVNWMEFFGESASTDAQVEEIRKVMNEKFTLSSGGKFARLNAGCVRKRINGAQVRHIPSKRDPSHAGIGAPGEQNREFLLELVKLVRSDNVFPAVLPEPESD